MQSFPGLASSSSMIVPNDSSHDHDQDHRPSNASLPATLSRSVRESPSPSVHPRLQRRFSEHIDQIHSRISPYASQSLRSSHQRPTQPLDYYSSHGDDRLMSHYSSDLPDAASFDSYNRDLGSSLRSSYSHDLKASIHSYYSDSTNPPPRRKELAPSATLESIYGSTSDLNLAPYGSLVTGAPDLLDDYGYSRPAVPGDDHRSFIIHDDAENDAVVDYETRPKSLIERLRHQSEISNMQLAEIERLEIENTKLAEHNDILVVDLQTKDSAIQDLSQVIEHFKRDIEHLKDQHRKIEDTNMALLEKKEIEIEALKDENDNLTIRVMESERRAYAESAGSRSAGPVGVDGADELDAAVASSSDVALALAPESTLTSDNHELSMKLQSSILRYRETVATRDETIELLRQDNEQLIAELHRMQNQQPLTSDSPDGFSREGIIESMHLQIESLENELRQVKAEALNLMSQSKSQFAEHQAKFLANEEEKRILRDENRYYAHQNQQLNEKVVSLSKSLRHQTEQALYAASQATSSSGHAASASSEYYAGAPNLQLSIVQLALQDRPSRPSEIALSSSNEQIASELSLLGPNESSLLDGFVDAAGEDTVVIRDVNASAEEMDSLYAEVERLRHSVQIHEGENRALRAELLNQLSRNKDDRANAQAAKHGSKDEARGKDRKIAKLEARIAELEGQVDDLQSEVHTRSTEGSVFFEEAERLSREVEVHAAEKTALSDQLSTAHRLLEEAETDSRQLRAEVLNQINSIKDSQSDIEAERLLHRQSLQERDQKIQELERSLEKAHARTESLQLELRSVSPDWCSPLELAKWENEKEQLLERLKTSEEKLAEMQAIVVAIEREKSVQIQAAMDEMEVSRSSLRGQMLETVSDYLNRLAAQEAEKMRLQDRLLEAERKCKQLEVSLESQVAKLKKQHQKAQSLLEVKHEQTVLQLEHERLEFELRVQQLELSLAEVSDMLAAKSNEHDQLVAAHRDAQSSSLKAIQDIEAAMKQISDEAQTTIKQLHLCESLLEEKEAQLSNLQEQHARDKELAEIQVREELAAVVTSQSEQIGKLKKMAENVLRTGHDERIAKDKEIAQLKDEITRLGPSNDAPNPDALPHVPAPSVSQDDSVDYKLLCKQQTLELESLRTELKCIQSQTSEESIPPRALDGAPVGVEVPASHEPLDQCTVVSGQERPVPSEASSDMFAQLNTLTESNRALSVALLDAQRRYDEAQQAVKATEETSKGIVDSFEKEIALYQNLGQTLQARTDTVEMENAALRETARALEVRLRSASELAESLQMRLTLQDSVVLKLSTLSEENNRHITSLQNAADALRSGQDEARTLVALKTSEISQLQVLIKNREDQLEQLQTSHQQTLAAMEQTLGQATHAVEERDAHIQSLAAECDQLHAQVKALLEASEGVKHRNGLLEIANEKLRLAADNASRRMSEVGQLHGRELAEKQGQILELEQQLGALLPMNADLRSSTTISRLQSRVEELALLWNTEQSKNQALNEQMSIMNDEILELASKHELHLETAQAKQALEQEFIESLDLIQHLEVQLNELRARLSTTEQGQEQGPSTDNWPASSLSSAASIPGAAGLAGTSDPPSGAVSVTHRTAGTARVPHCGPRRDQEDSQFGVDVASRETAVWQQALESTIQSTAQTIQQQQSVIAGHETEIRALLARNDELEQQVAFLKMQSQAAAECQQTQAHILATIAEERQQLESQLEAIKGRTTGSAGAPISDEEKDELAATVRCLAKALSASQLQLDELQHQLDQVPQVPCASEPETVAACADADALNELSQANQEIHRELEQAQQANTCLAQELEELKHTTVGLELQVAQLQKRIRSKERQERSRIDEFERVFAELNVMMWQLENASSRWRQLSGSVQVPEHHRFNDHHHESDAAWKQDQHGADGGADAPIAEEPLHSPVSMPRKEPSELELVSNIAFTDEYSSSEGRRGVVYVSPSEITDTPSVDAPTAEQYDGVLQSSSQFSHRLKMILDILESNEEQRRRETLNREHFTDQMADELNRIQGEMAQMRKLLMTKEMTIERLQAIVQRESDVADNAVKARDTAIRTLQSDLARELSRSAQAIAAQDKMLQMLRDAGVTVGIHHFFADGDEDTEPGDSESATSEHPE